jgi:hypothetical protein
VSLSLAEALEANDGLPEVKEYDLGDDLLLVVVKRGQYSEHIHVVVCLVVSESSKAFVLYDFVYNDSWKVRMFRAELEGRELEAEERAFFEEVDRLRRGEEWKGTSEG